MLSSESDKRGMQVELATARKEAAAAAAQLKHGLANWQVWWDAAFWPYVASNLACLGHEESKCLPAACLPAADLPPALPCLCCLAACPPLPAAIFSYRLPPLCPAPACSWTWCSGSMCTR